MRLNIWKGTLDNWEVLSSSQFLLSFFERSSGDDSWVIASQSLAVWKVFTGKVKQLIYHPKGFLLPQLNQLRNGNPNKSLTNSVRHSIPPSTLLFYQKPNSTSKNLIKYRSETLYGVMCTFYDINSCLLLQLWTFRLRLLAPLREISFESEFPSWTRSKSACLFCQLCLHKSVIIEENYWKKGQQTTCCIQLISLVPTFSYKWIKEIHLVSGESPSRNFH